MIIWYGFYTNSEQISYYNKNTKDIEFINSICNRQPPNNFTIVYYFIQINLCKNTMKMCSLTHIFKTMNINHQSCPPSYKLSNYLSKISGLHSTININIYMLVELCASNYATFNGLVNGVDGIFKTSTTYC